MISYTIAKLSEDLIPELERTIDNKTKPPGSLGKLEALARQIGRIQNTCTPVLQKPLIIVFAADHGIAEEGIVNPYPQEVTYQMVYNFLAGGAAINVFSRQHGIRLKVVDAGVKHDFPDHPDLIKAKIGNGTQNYLYSPAMSGDDCLKALEKGGQIVEQAHQEGCNIIGFGEMGIGNTSSAALLMSAITGIPIENCVGKGTGTDEAGLAQKTEVLRKVLQRHSPDGSAFNTLSTLGGFEIAMMCGAMLRAAEKGMTVLVDGFIATAALLVASRIDGNVQDYCIFCHRSGEKGHKALLEFLQADPLLDLGMRLGEGTGAAMAYPLIQSAAGFLNEMASFQSAGVDNKISQDA